MAVAKELLDILACPACKSDVTYDEKNQKICCVNPQCRRKYPVQEDIPVMLIEESTVD